MSVASKANIDAWFERIGFAGSIAPSLETLGQLVQMHVAAIPFENLDPLMGAPVRLDLSNLQQKLLFDRRGGYCLEHNLLLKAMLEELDYEVKAHAAVVLWNHSEPTDDPPTHLVLTVGVAGVTYLVDVGFGGQTPTAPLRLRSELEQATPHEPFRLIDDAGTWRLESLIGEDWRPLYRFTLAPVSDDELGQMNERASSSPTFRDGLIASRAEKGRRLVLGNLRFVIHVTGGESEARMLTSVAELREVLSGPLGIHLPAADRLDPALDRIVATSSPPDQS
ncbi:arylamine N-acetyltransferase [Devosia sp. ZB163]|uniref:arylamine N-acetyltransferase family protein n=1 Tax=Devosia sp. ZB163 TaxID=3025938 RepID=UPI0023615627|nr:arylamine N-acetyltransferase [Devosia sp. ZB163]MDC9822856.1 arylamine N-acetyltransferase [Devosia sp. ZB163]